MSVAVPGNDTAIVDRLLTQLGKHKEALGWVDYRTSLPPLAEIFRDIFDNSVGQPEYVPAAAAAAPPPVAPSTPVIGSSPSPLLSGRPSLRRWSPSRAALPPGQPGAERSVSVDRDHAGGAGVGGSDEYKALDGEEVVGSALRFRHLRLSSGSSPGSHSAGAGAGNSKTSTPRLGHASSATAHVAADVAVDMAALSLGAPAAPGSGTTPADASLTSRTAERA